MTSPELTALLSSIGTILTAFGVFATLILAYGAKKSAEQNTIDTKALKIEINHRMESFLALTQSAAFAAGLEEQRVHQTLPPSSS